MLEARLLVKLVEAKTLWDTPPYYTNDAQDVIKDATSMAVDTEWENRISELMTVGLIPFDQLKANFFAEHPEFTEDDLCNSESGAYFPFHEVCQEADKAYKHHVSFGLNDLIEWLCSTIGDKVHRRNLQIADLKRNIQIAGEARSPFTAMESRLITDTISASLTDEDEDADVKRRILGKLEKMT